MRPICQGKDIKKEFNACAISMELPADHTLRAQLDDKRSFLEDMLEEYLGYFRAYFPLVHRAYKAPYKTDPLEVEGNG